MTDASGFCRAAKRSRTSLIASLALLATVAPSTCFARDTKVAIPPVTLDAALTILARESGVEIVSTEAGLRNVRTRAVTGTMPVRQALDRLLDGTGYRAVAIAGGGYRVVRGPQPVRKKPRPAPAPAPPPPTSDIVVTASKQRVPLLRYPGTLTSIAVGRLDPQPAGGDLSTSARTLPILQSTQLGAGRNKIFIRGIADSSFNGSTQSPSSIYLDDVQLNYSGPDPGLRLYDLKSIDILEGPQGTLYGAGAIGGVIRLTSNPVDLSATSGSIAGGVTATRGGEPGGDIAAMINLPIVEQQLGIRAVGYAVRDGGYIDDAERGLRNINRTDTLGGRLALSLAPGGGWHVEASGVGQWIRSRDSQYAEVVAGPLRRDSRIAQPFDNQLLFGRIVISKDWTSGLRLVSATGVVGYSSNDRFDATPPPSGMAAMPVLYTADHDKLLLSQETRLTRSLPSGKSWVVGFTLVSDRDILARALGSPGSPADIIGITNLTKAASLFAETTFPVLPGLSVTAGGRVTAARTDGNPSSTPRSVNFVKGRSTLRVDPTLAFSWQLDRAIAVFARFQTGYRTGGLAVTPGIGRVADYQPDDIRVGEVGVRKLRGGPLGLELSGSASVAWWNNIQADFISRRGNPSTANIGDARIETIEANADWIPFAGLRADLSFLFTHNVVIGPIAQQSRQNNRRLPETPPLAMTTSVDYSWTMGEATPRLGWRVNYVGRSVLGTGDFLNLSQGNYWVVGANAGLRWSHFDVGLTVDNVTDIASNRFAFGNPFALASRQQTTPARPLNARLGIAMYW